MLESSSSFCSELCPATATSTVSGIKMSWHKRMMFTISFFNAALDQHILGSIHYGKMISHFATLLARSGGVFPHTLQLVYPRDNLVPTQNALGRQRNPA